MAQVVAYEIEVQSEGGWRTLRSFEPTDLDRARSDMKRLEKDPPGSGLKLVEETLGEDGLFKRRTLLFKRFEDKGGAAPASPGSSRSQRGGRRDGSRARTASGGTPAARKTSARPAAKGPSGGKGVSGAQGKSGGRTKSSGPGNQVGRTAAAQAAGVAAGRRLGFGGSLSELLSFLFVPVRTRQPDGSDGPERLEPPPVAGPTRMRGQVPVFEDELEIDLDDLVVADTTYRQFRSFFDALNDGGVLEAARRDLDFSRRISLFAIGVLFSIEHDINIFSERGRSVVGQVLRFFIQSHDAIGHFVETMERYLTEDDAPQAIRVGSKCFRHYQNADLDALKRTFEEAFGISEALKVGLGGKVQVGILFTDIVDSTRLTSEIGDAAAQSVIDHHEQVVLDMCRRFGGRKVKHLGDGLMLSFANKERMVACAVAVIDMMKGLANRPEVPSYKIRCGGHFGEAIHKEDDFFGSTVQLAARISAKAGDNEACFSTMLFDRDLPTYALFADRGAVELKGVSQQVALAVYG